MLPSTPSFELNALNRVTFGARDLDVQRVRQMGWAAWVDEQLDPPAGDDPALAAFLQSQVMRIRYNGQPPTKDIPGWPSVDQLRPLNYLRTSVPVLWDMARNVEVSVAANELTRIQQEFNAATWIRNTHAAYQVREFMVDFWNNHFNVGRQADIFGSAALPAYDAEVIRPRALGNFEDLLGAVATSTAMLRYLDNAASTAAHPNENYARELLELHTLGGGSYLGVKSPAAAGVSPQPGQAPLLPFVGPGSAAAGALQPVIARVRKMAASAVQGFSDQDIIAASRALSGWTLEQGQSGPAGALPFTGKFVYNPLQHNTQAGTFMGVDLSPLSGDMEQGLAVLALLAHHPVTAEFVCTKIARRIFGDAPPPAVIERAKRAWLLNRDSSDQIKRVMAEILLGGDEIGSPPSKLRRPYERIIAFFRATDSVVTAFELADIAVAALGDGPYVWPTPDGRPDTDSQWLSTSINLYNWNLLLLLWAQPAIRTALGAQTPPGVTTSATALVEYWVGRLVGYRLRPEAMAALVDDATSYYGVMAAYASGGVTNIENGLRRLIALIGCAPEFGFR